MACSKLEARGHLLHKTGTPPKHFSRECTLLQSPNMTLRKYPKLALLQPMSKCIAEKSCYFGENVIFDPLCKNLYGSIFRSIRYLEN